jgi:hypothetical protein
MMNWINQVGGLLQQYAGTAAAPAPDTVDRDFDQFAQAAPQSVIADGLAEAFRSEQTPEFSTMAAHLFNNSTGQQRAGLLNSLLAMLGPAVIGQILGQRGSSGVLGGLLSGGQREVTPEQAEQVPPEEVRELAKQAEQKDPSIIDQFSNFYAQHPTLIKTLGGAALTIALAKIAQKHSGL